jgi:hypothetical protein
MPTLFHEFHQTWTINIRNALNGGLLPKGSPALVITGTPPKTRNGPCPDQGVC